ncbi:hypothetical protein HOU12_gp28 [Dickeya phage Katbat]|uniref:Uncharacterized protein n=1 Tax=Dickeya phage Katbat TaxID=2320191 RepID=A0A385IFW9_9CAUD|nr:hypothetical protein HOU12_gp28 [Dickeya phage Katbat]AXY81745.1 hypothetical protein [Dickeya phage Katbat]
MSIWELDALWELLHEMDVANNRRKEVRIEH